MMLKSRIIIKYLSKYKFLPAEAAPTPPERRAWEPDLLKCGSYSWTSSKEQTMGIVNSEPRQISPTHPGEMLREDFVPDYNLSVAGLASALGVSRQTIHELLREERAITPLMALRLARLFGNSPMFWLRAQQARDLWEIEQRHRNELIRIQPLPIAA
jgi:addiction module HigA family antidote